ncbi:MAG: transglutaminase family protein [Microvirgula sp.]
MKLAIEHDTIYRYDHPVRRSIQYLRLTPRSSARVRVLDWRLALPARAKAGTDAYGNTLHVLTLDQPHVDIHLRAAGTVETDDREADVEIDNRLPPEVFLRDTPLSLADAALSGFAAGFAGAVAADRRRGFERLMAALAEHMPYTPGVTHAATSAAEAFAGRLGVCQDHSHAMIACARRLGVPARYVSGYLAPDIEHVASHAWAERGLDGGWLGYDASNLCLAAGRHVKLAVGLDYLDACPVRGMRVGGGDEIMHIAARVVSSAPEQ